MFRKLFSTILIAMVSGLCVLSAQVKSINVTPGSFTGISVSNDFVLDVTEGEVFSVEILVDDMLKDYVQAAVDQSTGILSIYLEDKKITPEVKRYYRSRNADVPVFRANVCMPHGSLRSLELSGNASLRGIEDGTVDPSSFFLAFTGNASAASLSVKAASMSLSFDRKSSGSIDVECENLTLDVLGNSNVSVLVSSMSTALNLASMASLVLDGKTESMTVEAKGSVAKAIFNGEARFVRYVLGGTVNINAVNMKCEEANVEISGMSTLTEAATEKLFITLSGGGRLVFKNSPDIYINSIRNSSVSKYMENETDGYDSDRRTL